MILHDNSLSQPHSAEFVLDSWWLTSEEAFESCCIRICSITNKKQNLPLTGDSFTIPLMHRVLAPITAALVVLLLSGCSHFSPKLHYPFTRTTNQVDYYGSVAVRDPYRWLEDDNSPETKKWVEAENKVTFSYLAKIPQHDAIRQRLTKLWNFERYGRPFKEGGRYFFSKNDGLQNQSVLYTMSSLDAEPRELLDPNTLSTDGTVALAGLSISDDGRLMAYGLSASGSDWEEWKVRDVETGKDLGDDLKWVKFSGASWTKDGQGFFYSRYDEPTEAAKLTKVNYFPEAVLSSARHAAIEGQTGL